jgi:flagellar basal body P-ring formation protein FlgA
VLSHAVAMGATLSADDIDMTKMRRDRVAADVAIQPTQMIGKATRRPIQAGTPVRLGDLEAPILVHKGDLVTIQLATATLQISVQGKALEDGAKGALVQVANTKSNRVIDAAVVAPGTVAVTSPGAPQTALR